MRVAQSNIHENKETAATAAYNLLRLNAGAPFGLVAPSLPEGLAAEPEPVGEPPAPVGRAEPLPLTIAVSFSEKARM